MDIPDRASTGARLRVITQSALVAQQAGPALIVTSIHGKGHSTAENIKWALPGEQHFPPHQYTLAACDKWDTRQETPQEIQLHLYSSVQKCQKMLLSAGGDSEL